MTNALSWIGSGPKERVICSFWEDSMRKAFFILVLMMGSVGSVHSWAHTGGAKPTCSAFLNFEKLSFKNLIVVKKRGPEFNSQLFSLDLNQIISFFVSQSPGQSLFVVLAEGGITKADFKKALKKLRFDFAHHTTNQYGHSLWSYIEESRSFTVVEQKALSDVFSLLPESFQKKIEPHFNKILEGTWYENERETLAVMMYLLNPQKVPQVSYMLILKNIYEQEGRSKESAKVAQSVFNETFSFKFSGMTPQMVIRLYHDIKSEIDKNVGAKPMLEEAIATLLDRGIISETVIKYLLLHKGYANFFTLYNWLAHPKAMQVLNQLLHDGATIEEFFGQNSQYTHGRHVFDLKDYIAIKVLAMTTKNSSLAGQINVSINYYPALYLMSKTHPDLYYTIDLDEHSFSKEKITLKNVMNLYEKKFSAVALDRALREAGVSKD